MYQETIILLATLVILSVIIVLTGKSDKNRFQR